MDKEYIVEEAKRKIQTIMNTQDGAHDFMHIQRVFDMSMYLAEGRSNLNLFVIKMAALLHELDDHKMDIERKYSVRTILNELGVTKEDQERILEITDHQSFTSYKQGMNVTSEEGKIVQDADRLDAIGAIGIARAFHYGGKIGNSIYDCGNGKPNTLQHFEDKLFRLEGLMNTKEAKKIAKERTKYMEDYVDKLLGEISILQDEKHHGR